MFVLALGAAAAWFFFLRPVDPRPEIARLADDYLAAWEAERWAEMAALTTGPPPAEFEETHAAMLEDLRVEEHTVRRGGEVLLDEELPDRATVPFDATFTLEGIGEWTYAGELPFLLLEGDGGWRVDWSPAVLYHELEPGLRFSRVREWPARAAILDRNGDPITASRPVVEVGIEGQRVTDPEEVVAALGEHAGVGEEAVRRALDQAEANPEWFIPVARLRRERYDEVRDAIRPVPGLVFRETTSRFPPDDEFARQTVGGVGEITAELLDQFGDPYRVGDTVGRSGLELAFERQLAGSPTGEIRLVDAGGAFVRTLERFEGEDGESLRTTLDIEVQQAADAAVEGIEEPVGLVVLDAETAEIRAVVSRPLDDFNRALAGRYAPGSTFKTVTTLAALDDGVTPDDTVSCPGEVTIGGRRFRNAHDLALGDIPFRTAFAESCNTAFVQVAADLPAGALAETAARLGFDAEYAGFPLRISGGQFPEPGDVAELAAAAIGQARVVASPLHMASVAAAVASGRWQQPALVVGQEAGGAAGEPLEAVETLRDLMRLVVTEGTGTAADVAGREVRGKTGTAEFGTERDEDGELPTHAWFIGFSDDLAFAVVVEGGGGGGEVAAPVIARFLGGLGS